jgi:hypothetical protein
MVFEHGKIIEGVSMGRVLATTTDHYIKSNVDQMRPCCSADDPAKTTITLRPRISAPSQHSPLRKTLGSLISHLTVKGCVQLVRARPNRHSSIVRPISLNSILSEKSHKSVST